jgi:hypothetical protein
MTRQSPLAWEASDLVRYLLDDNQRVMAKAHAVHRGENVFGWYSSRLRYEFLLLNSPSQCEEPGGFDFPNVKVIAERVYPGVYIAAPTLSEFLDWAQAHAFSDYQNLKITYERNYPPSLVGQGWSKWSLRRCADGCIELVWERQIEGSLLAQQVAGTTLLLSCKPAW